MRYFIYTFQLLFILTFISFNSASAKANPAQTLKTGVYSGASYPRSGCAHIDIQKSTVGEKVYVFINYVSDPISRMFCSAEGNPWNSAYPNYDGAGAFVCKNGICETDIYDVDKVLYDYYMSRLMIMDSGNTIAIQDFKCDYKNSDGQKDKTDCSLKVTRKFNFTNTQALPAKKFESYTSSFGQGSFSKNCAAAENWVISGCERYRSGLYRKCVVLKKNVNKIKIDGDTQACEGVWILEGRE